MAHVLVTGGAGYIGSHTVVELIKNNHSVTIVDNFSNSKKDVLNRLAKICGQDIPCYDVDCTDKNSLRNVFSEALDSGNPIDAIIHFAGFKAVGESVNKPAMYYRNNIDSFLTTYELADEYNVKSFIFSSSATVYGMSEDVPFNENSPTGICTNPYGWTKWMIEQMIEDLSVSNPNMNFILLRYFNPVGAHESGIIGEDPCGIPNNLFPYISRVANGVLDSLTIFGNDYNTPDGTCLRDYIHVCDLALGHVKALNYLLSNKCHFDIFNLGTGNAISVTEAVQAYEKACGHKIPHSYGKRRAGDIAICYADTTKAKQKLGFVANRDINDMCASSWKWQQFCDNNI